MLGPFVCLKGLGIPPVCLPSVAIGLSVLLVQVYRGVSFGSLCASNPRVEC